MLDVWQILILVSAIASCVAVAMSLGVLRRLVNAVEHGHGAAAHGSIPLDAGGVSVGTKLPNFELHEPDREGTPDTSSSVSFYRLLTVPRIIVLTRHGCSGCERLIKALNEAPGPVDWMNIVVVIDPETPISSLIESTRQRGVRFLVQQDSAASHAFQHRASPHAFAVAQAASVVDKVVTDDVDTLAALAAGALHLRATTNEQTSSSESVSRAQLGREVIR